MTYTSTQGVLAEEAYHQIVNVNYNTDNKVNAKMTVKIFMNDDARQKGYEPLDINVVDFTMVTSDKGANPLSQAYTGLKTKTKLIDSKGRERDIDYTDKKKVRDV